ncbi:MAG: phage antirepressor KilAC domain-containing protein [Dysgonamonadaceae bacterium]|jgi:phage antirepressor YoqD-like protein|nr:phage antirepressor KilAC domain-containing protein [Dysgonamonadaceae bacterium]
METNIQLSKVTTMSSREIAELTGKRHDHVLRDCDVLNETYKKLALPRSGEGVQSQEVEEYHRRDRTQYKYLKPDTFDKIINVFNEKQFPLIQQGYYTHPNTGDQQHREYRLTRMQCFDLMTGYNIELRIKVNRRWEELETNRQPPIASLSRKDLALMVIQSEEENERLQGEVQAQKQLAQMLEGEKEHLTTEVKQLAPKAEYTDKVLQSTSTYTATQIAKELGMSAIALGRKLHDAGIMFKQSGQWMLYAKYQDKGYTSTRTHYYNHDDGTTGTKNETVWTERGRAFVHWFLDPNKISRNKQTIASNLSGTNKTANNLIL